MNTPTLPDEIAKAFQEFANASAEHWMRELDEHISDRAAKSLYDKMEAAKAAFIELLTTTLASKDEELSRLRDLARQHETDRDLVDTYERHLREVGQIIGCEHIDEGLARCVREVIEEEKSRRVYYQDIVYTVCNELDRAFGKRTRRGEGIVCGTVDEPTRQVQEHMKELADRDFARAVAMGIGQAGESPAMS